MENVKNNLKLDNFDVPLPKLHLPALHFAQRSRFGNYLFDKIQNTFLKY